jgi:hypothetical protein
MDRLTFYKSFYETELKNKEDLNNSINNPIIIISLIFGVISYVFEKTNIENLNSTNITIVVLLIIVSILLCKSIYHIIMSYNNGIKGYAYNILGTNSEFEIYRNELIEYSKLEPSKINPKKEYEESIITRLIECTDKNNELNIKRSGQVYLTKKYLVISLILIFITFLIQALNQIL